MPAKTIAFFQFDAREKNRAENFDKVVVAAGRAAERGAEILVLPELWACGYDLAAARAEGGWDREIAAVAELSRQRGLAVIGTHLEEPESPETRPSNCAIAHENGVERGRYRKTHLFGPLGEPDHMRPGNTLPRPFPLVGVQVAMTICYDLRFPEVFRPAAIDGAELFTVCAQWPSERVSHWRSLLVARAIENQAYVLGVNRDGRFGETLFGGDSMLVSPTGDILTDAGEGEQLCFGEIDPLQVRAKREAFPVFDDLRSDLY